MLLAGATLLAAATGFVPPAPPSMSIPETRASAKRSYAPDRVLVGYQPGTQASAMRAVERSSGARLLRKLGSARLVSVPSGRVKETMKALVSHRVVRYAEPDYLVELLGAPNDEHFESQWGLRNTGQVIRGRAGTPGADVDAVRAWDVTTGSREVVVGVIDDGIEYDHLDLVDNMWKNPGGVNGCPAGTYGYDAFLGTCTPSPGSHGTAVAGIIGAVGGNGIGVAGVAQSVRLMVLKALNDNVGLGTSSTFIAAVDWAVRARQAGVNLRVLNCSCGVTGGGSGGSAVRDAIEQAGKAGILFAAASGNDGWDADRGDKYSTPCAIDLDTIICATATDNRDELASFSNTGSVGVDLAAPGVDVYTTSSGSAHSLYMFFTGTSASAPLVAGAAALLFANGETSVSAVRSKILDNVDKLPGLDGRVATGGRLNVYRALTGSASERPTAPPTTSPTPSPTSTPTLSPTPSAKVSPTTPPTTTSSTPVPATLRPTGTPSTTPPPLATLDGHPRGPQGGAASADSSPSDGRPPGGSTPSGAPGKIARPSGEALDLFTDPTEVSDGARLATTVVGIGGAVWSIGYLISRRRRRMGGTRAGPRRSGVE